MDTMTWRPIARAAMLGAAWLLAGCGGGGGGSDGADGMQTAQAAAAGACGSTGCAPLRLTIQGTTLLDPQGRAVRLRGVNVDGIDAQDAAIIAGQFNMNTIRLRITYSKDTRADTPSGFRDDYLQQIDGWVAAARSRGLWMVLEMRGSDAFTTHPDFYDIRKTGPCDPKVELVRCPNFGYYRKTWRFLAERFRGTDYIAGYGLLAEPSADKTGAANPVATLVSFQRALMDEISRVDRRTPFFIGPNYNYDTMEYRLDDYFIAAYAGRVVYAVNFLVPKEWINHGTWTLPCLPTGDCKPTYPFADPVDGYGSLLAGADPAAQPEKVFNEQRVKPGNYQKTLSKGFIPWYLQWALDFRDRHQVPLYVDQFGASTEALGQLAYEGDLIDFFEDRGLHWTRWSYNAAGPDSGGRTLLPPNYAAIRFYTELASRWESPR
ncbi:cellulase family glycosylhydrolase [Aquincola sp. S2]|uniref:Cellulase family glycosylhydrolase n=1 Tax=Pseudaquabacterium terrae TaxID=2732868 RepID=A0ABX2ENB4_9BURK|nr:cellulase family glycosylhydrolase [Aquabacterium terrae]NRF70031.1 cellulase family glycosylhydrolase [Aquabacterium terrae]